jgi:hypothetical protein
MIERVEDYLQALSAELVGSDPATDQDALSDAEEHLRTAFAALRRETPDAGDSAWR